MTAAAMPATAGDQVKPDRIMGFAWGYAIPLMIEAAIECKLFDILDKSPRTIEQLSEASGASPRGLRILANGLVAFKLLAKDADGHYALTPESAKFLVSDQPGFLGGLYKHVSKQLLPKWMQLPRVVQTGRPAIAVNQKGAGAEFFESFVEDIFPMSYPAARKLAESLNLQAASAPVRVLDLASGSGVWGIALAERSPHVAITAVDWNEVLPVTRRVAARHGVADRFSYISGDLQTVDFGEGYNLATLGHILHSEGEERSRALLKKTFNALTGGGTIAIAEFVANDDRSGPENAMIFAVNMLVNTDRGDTYTFTEIGRWLADAGFVDVRQLEAPGPSPLILATKPA